ncbi:MAG: 2-phosphosulfolactate phosphatase, partial [Ktedonobacterales bacterium]
GRGDRPAIDDTLCAGYLCQELYKQAAIRGYVASLGEGARIASAVLRDILATGSLLDGLATSDAAHAIMAIGLTSDLDWCATTDASRAVPRVTGYDEHGLLIVENQPPANM